MIGGKNLNNTGLKKQNKIAKVNWSNWDVNPTFHDENIQPDSIVEVPEIVDKLILDNVTGKVSTVKAVSWGTSIFLILLGCFLLCLCRGELLVLHPVVY